jgi:hypothetical protein
LRSYVHDSRFFHLLSVRISLRQGITVIGQVTCLYVGLITYYRAKSEFSGGRSQTERAESCGGTAEAVAEGTDQESVR